MIFTKHLITPIEVIDLVNNNKISYYQLIKHRHSDLFEYAKALKGTSLKEQLYNYCYPGEYRCLTCGSVQVKFQEFTTGYKKYCSNKCVVNSKVVKQGQQLFLSNPKKIKARIKKAEATALKKYGAKYYVQTPEGKLRNSISNTKFYRTKFPAELNGRSRKQYTAAVRHRTNLVYQEFKHILDPNNLRSRDYVLDHVYSVFDGFVNEVPLDIICHPTNLKLIHKTDNSSKNCRSDKTIEQLYEDYSDSE